MAGPPGASFSGPGWTKDVLRSTGQGFQHSALVSQHKGLVASVEPAMPSRQESWEFLIHVSFPLKKKQYKAWPAIKETRAPQYSSEFPALMCPPIWESASAHTCAHSCVKYLLSRTCSWWVRMRQAGVREYCLQESCSIGRWGGQRDKDTNN